MLPSRGSDRTLPCALAFVSIVLLTFVLSIRLFVPQPFAPRVHVRWSADLSDEARVELEERFRLVVGERRDGSTWGYDLADPALANVQALIAHPATEDTHYIERSDGAISSNAPLGITPLPAVGLSTWHGPPWLEWIVLFAVAVIVAPGEHSRISAKLERNDSA